MEALKKLQNFKYERRDSTQSRITRNNNNNNVYNVSGWLASSGGAKFSKPIEEMSKEELKDRLKCFYTSARKKDGTYYRILSMKSVKACSHIIAAIASIAPVCDQSPRSATNRPDRTRAMQAIAVAPIAAGINDR